MMMNIIDQFHSFAEDFEKCIGDDGWSRLEKHLVNNATYANVGSPGPKCEGRAAILEYFRKDVSETDRKFDSRNLTAITQPTTDGNFLSRKWRTLYKLAGTPDLIVEGEARYWFEGDLIKTIEQELTPESQRQYAEWMKKYGNKLHS